MQLARSLNLSLVAEGVERAEELAYVESLGIEEVQGYFFAKPMSAEQLTHFLEASRGVA